MKTPAFAREKNLKYFSPFGPAKYQILGLSDLSSCTKNPIIIYCCWTNYLLIHIEKYILHVQIFVHPRRKLLKIGLICRLCSSVRKDK